MYKFLPSAKGFGGCRARLTGPTVFWGVFARSLRACDRGRGQRSARLVCSPPTRLGPGQGRGCNSSSGFPPQAATPYCLPSRQPLSPPETNPGVCASNREARRPNSVGVVAAPAQSPWSYSAPMHPSRRGTETWNL